MKFIMTNTKRLILNILLGIMILSVFAMFFFAMFDFKTISFGFYLIFMILIIYFIYLLQFHIEILETNNMESLKNID